MEKPVSYDEYQAIADSYAQAIDTRPHNALYERPALLSLLDDVTDKRILDAGCGPGKYSEILVTKKAVVTAIDASEKMLEHAKKRCPENVRFIHANLEEPLKFLHNNEFDGIVAPLVIAYIRDLNSLFAEFYRILNYNGWLLFSTEHPFFTYKYFNIGNYFEQKLVHTVWDGFIEKPDIKSYYRPLSAITSALISNAFHIEEILEPLPEAAFKDKAPADYEKLSQFPLFICIKARKRM